MTLIEADPYSRRVIGCAIEVHRTLGPGLLESIDEACFCAELPAAGPPFDRQATAPVVCKNGALDCLLRLDDVVEGAVVVEIKAI